MQMKKLYQNCYALLATAFNEDWGLTPIEGNMYGKASLCVNRGGYMESQIDGKTGYLIKADREKFVVKMKTLINNENLTKRLGKTAYQHSKKYDWGDYIEKLDKKLINLIKV
jgi:glycosyltransferase involved in cell wall biosynthesis